MGLQMGFHYDSCFGGFHDTGLSAIRLFAYLTRKVKR